MLVVLVLVLVLVVLVLVLVVVEEGTVDDTSIIWTLEFDCTKLYTTSFFGGLFVKYTMT